MSEQARGSLEMPAEPYVLYLHGFLSSPQSMKARQTLDHCERLGLSQQIAVPQMSKGPAETIKALRAIIEDKRDYQLGLIGS